MNLEQIQELIDDNKNLILKSCRDDDIEKIAAQLDVLIKTAKLYGEVKDFEDIKTILSDKNIYK